MLSSTRQRGAANVKPPSHSIDRHVASRLRLRRREAGVTQDMLADAVGVSFQQVQKYEEGTDRITAGAG